jgi:putative endonuclease
LALQRYWSMNDLRFVYVIRSQADPARHYVGATSDVAGRLAAHNRGQSAHSRKYVPWQLVVAIEFASVQAALDFERYLKSGSGRAFAKRHFG